MDILIRVDFDSILWFAPRLVFKFAKRTRRWRLHVTGDKTQKRTCRGRTESLRTLGPHIGIIKSFHFIGYKIVQFYKGPLGPEIKLRFYDYEMKRFYYADVRTKSWKTCSYQGKETVPWGPRAKLWSSVIEIPEARIHSHVQRFVFQVYIPQ